MKGKEVKEHGKMNDNGYKNGQSSTWSSVICKVSKLLFED